MATYPKIKSVIPLAGKRLRVTFVSGETKTYDCGRLLDELPFYALRDDAFFNNVHVDQGGYGIIWNDSVDLSESELWLHGETEAAPLSEQGETLGD